MKAIIEKQRELIELLKAPRYHEINDAIKRKESELASLKSGQSVEREEVKLHWSTNAMDYAKAFSQPQPEVKESQSAEEIWPNKVRLYMIEKSKFYEDERIYQYGFYDGYQYASQRLPSDNRKTIEDYLLEKGIITLSGMYDDKIIYQFRNIPYPDEIINIIIDYIKLK